MKQLLVLACATIAFSMVTGSAHADSIQGKIGVTGKIGMYIPSDNDFGPFNNKTDVGIIGGGGLIYGIDNNFAAEIDVTRSAFGSDYGDFGITNISMGAQYRFALSQPKLVPYVGVGLDILVIDADQRRNVDTTVGVHFSGGVDYFLMKRLALTAEAKVVVAPDTDINGPSGKVGNFDPTGVSTTVGVRFLFN